MFDKNVEACVAEVEKYRRLWFLAEKEHAIQHFVRWGEPGDHSDVEELAAIARYYGGMLYAAEEELATMVRIGPSKLETLADPLAANGDDCSDATS